MLQLGGSSWAKKMVVLRKKVSGMRLFHNLFVCVFYFGLLSYYVLKWAMWINRSRCYEVCYGYISEFS